MPGPPSVAGGPPWSASRVGRQDGRECTACSGAGNRGHETSPPGRFRRFVVRVLAERGLQPVSQPKPRHVKGRTGRSGPTRYTCSPRGPLAQLGERRLCTAEVRGSTPLRSTKVFHAHEQAFWRPSGHVVNPPKWPRANIRQTNGSSRWATPRHAASVKSLDVV